MRAAEFALAIKRTRPNNSDRARKVIRLDESSAQRIPRRRRAAQIHRREHCVVISAGATAVSDC